MRRQSSELAIALAWGPAVPLQWRRGMLSVALAIGVSTSLAYGGPTTAFVLTRMSSASGDGVAASVRMGQSRVRGALPPTLLLLPRSNTRRDALGVMVDRLRGHAKAIRPSGS
jgi:hypothetical protein